MRAFSLTVALLCSVCSVCSVCYGQNVISNPGFERGMESWHEHLSGAAKAAGQIDTTQAHTGKSSFHMTNASPFASNVYYRIFQTVPVQPNTRYVMGLWCKGKGVGQCWFGGGPQWLAKNSLPSGDFDWRWVCVEFTTGPEQQSYEFILLTESETGDLWLDDIYFAPVDSSAGDFYPPQVEKGLPPSCRFYPALSRDAAVTPPVVKMRSKDDPNFGFDAYFTWDAEGLHVGLTVLDATPGFSPNPKNLPAMCDVDGIQIALDTQPLSPKEGYTDSCYELGFSLYPDGKVAQYAWHAGGLDPYHAPTFPAKGKRTETGYQWNILLPWEKLQVDPANPPKALGVNIVINDDQAGKRRRWLEWTDGVAWGVKLPSLFAKLVRIEEKQPTSASYLIYDKTSMFTEKDFISGTFVQYAFDSLPAGKGQWFCTGANNEPVLRWGESELPAVTAGSTRMEPVSLPGAQLTGEGQYHVVVKSPEGQTWCSVPFQRANLIRRVTELKQKNETRLAAVRKLAEEKNVLSNAYVEMGVAVGDRFCKRLETHKEQPLDWSILQMEQVSDVLDWLEEYVREGAVFDSPKITGGPVELRDGVFYTEAQTVGGAPAVQPFFFGGFGHFFGAISQAEQLRAMGFSSIQTECGPSAMWAKGKIVPMAETKVALVQQASKMKMKVDFLLSPHYFPEWAAGQPGAMTDNPSWNKFNINHPVAKQAIGDWIDEIFGRLKDEPTMMSTCLMNEPSYCVSGKDEQSKPLWAEFLRKKHGTIETLNALYGTKYENFEQVPVPPPPSFLPDIDVGPCRAFYDWGLFNMDNFTEWHRFMHDRVKAVAPKLYTHSKIIIDRQLGQGSCFGLGTEPERLADVTDLAGCDAWATWPGGEYSYGWWQVMFYDLLNSFRNQPVVNTEYHILPDGGTTTTGNPPEHIYTAYWHAGLHHLGMHTTWMWEEPVQPSCMGNMSLRPALIAASAKAMLDLNRLGNEVAAINQAKPDVAILYSIPSILWQEDYEDTIRKLYAAMNFMGLSITFVSEKQLAEGKIPPADWIFIPHATHATQPAVDALAAWAAKEGKHVVLVDSNCLAFDEYHRPRTIPAPLNEAAHLKTTKGNGKDLLPKLQALFQAGKFSPTTLTNVETSQPAWGVEFRCVPYNGKTLVSILNLLSTPQTVRLDLPGTARDLITGQAVDLQNLSLGVLKPMLLEVVSK